MDKDKKDTKYIETIGRRKTSSARVRLTPAAKSSFVVNGLPANEYFKTNELRKIIIDPYNTEKPEDKFTVTVVISGGGVHSQAEAIRHGLARALVIFDAEMKPKLKQSGYLKRDPRAK